MTAPCAPCVPTATPRPHSPYGCYHGSVAQTVPLAWRNRHGADGDAVLQRADALIVLAERARDLYARYGAPPQKLSLLPNFVLADEPSGATVPDDRWLFVGRLFPEKGVLELLRAWPAGQRLDVVGDGVLSDDVQRALPPGSRLLGSMDHDDVRRLFPHYQGLVLPSRWPESATPLVVLEALAAGVPVVALAGNAAADLVAETGCGAVVGSDAPLGRCPGGGACRARRVRFGRAGDVRAAVPAAGVADRHHRGVRDGLRHRPLNARRDPGSRSPPLPVQAH